MTSIYQEWGFQGNLFDTNPLPPSPDGQQQLVGRDLELNSVMRRIRNPPKLATVEGFNGLGKTSLINVAAFRCYREFSEGQSDQLLLPCRRVFQIHDGEELRSWFGNVLLEVAQTLLENTDRLERVRPPSFVASRLDAFLNSPLRREFKLSIAKMGGSYSSSVQETSAFAASGFPKALGQWLDLLFPDGQGGGVVCIIDNLELLKRSSRAREVLEILRDDLFAVPGLRWVLCGTPGIVHGAASSPRLEGRLHSPVSISSLPVEHAKAVLGSRIESHAVVDDWYLPLTDLDFQQLFKALNGELRSTISHADTYCMSVSDLRPHEWPRSTAKRRAHFAVWFRSACISALELVRESVGAGSMRLFEAILSAHGGEVSERLFARFGFSTRDEFEESCSELERHLMLQVIAPPDGQEPRLRVTPKGWLAGRALLAEQGREAFLD